MLRVWNSVISSVSVAFKVPHTRQLSSSNPVLSFSSLFNNSPRIGIQGLLQPARKDSLISPNGEGHNLVSTNGQLTAGVYVPARGMKVKGVLKRRCKDCYFIWQEGIKYNLCKTYGRHKQMRKPPYWKNLRIFTHASQCPKRPW